MRVPKNYSFHDLNGSDKQEYTPLICLELTAPRKHIKYVINSILKWKKPVSAHI